MRALGRHIRSKSVIAFLCVAVLIIILWSLAKSHRNVVQLNNSQYFTFPQRDVQVKDFDNCAKIIAEDFDAIRRALQNGGKLDFKIKSPHSYITDLQHGCQHFATKRGYILNHLTNEEKNFPIAYTIIFYTSFHQMETLLRSIYRPQNYYCIHLDKFASPIMHKALEYIADCFENIILPYKNIDVIPGRMSVLTPELLCMRELLKHRGWRYLINLTGQEFPLKTNRQIVKILKEFRGHNDVETSESNTDFIRRWDRSGPPPHNLTLYKGAVHVSLSRAFVQFILTDPRVQDLLKYLQNTRHPAESFFTTVNNNPSLNAPGGFKGTYEDALAKPWMTRLKLWEFNNETCHGTYDAGICIFGIADLPRLTHEPHLFANKFKWHHEPLALRCMQEWLFNQTRDEYLHGTSRYSFNTSFYYSIHHQIYLNRQTLHSITQIRSRKGINK